MAQGAGITIRTNDTAIAEVFARIEEAGKDFKPLLDDIGASEVVSTQVRFETETDPEGKAWAPLRPSTIRAKKGDRRILRRRSRLFGSLTHQADQTVLLVGTNVRTYPAVHQFGVTIQQYARSQMATFQRNKDGNLRFAKKRTKAKSAYARPITIGEHTVTIPKRAYLGISDDDRKMIIEKAEAYLTASFTGAA